MAGGWAAQTELGRVWVSADFLFEDPGEGRWGGVGRGWLGRGWEWGEGGYPNRPRWGAVSKARLTLW